MLKLFVHAAITLVHLKKKEKKSDKRKISYANLCPCNYFIVHTAVYIVHFTKPIKIVYPSSPKPSDYILSFFLKITPTHYLFILTHLKVTMHFSYISINVFQKEKRVKRGVIQEVFCKKIHIYILPYPTTFTVYNLGL